MSSGAANDDFKAAAAQGFGDNGVGTGSVEDEAVADRIFPSGLGKDVAHSAQVALAFLADITDKKQRRGERNFGGAQGGGNGQECRGSGSIVRNSGTVEAVALLTQVERGSGGENGIDVRTEHGVLRGWG